MRVFGCTAVRRQDPARHVLSVSRDAERTMSPSWWTQHRAEDARRRRADPAVSD